MGITIGTAMLAAAVLGALVGALLGLAALVRASAYHGPEARLLVVLAHHLAEPALTGLLLVLSVTTAAPWILILAAVSFLGLLVPLAPAVSGSSDVAFCYQDLAGWGVARVATCAFVWLSLLTINAAGSGDAPLVGVTTVIGTAVLWASIRKGRAILAEFPDKPAQQRATTQPS